MQEASSVIKAIEKGWESAGKPKEFSVKVFEEPKKNFIGITVHSAKIGIFFDDKNPIKKAEKEEFKKREHVTAKNISSAQVKQYPEQPLPLEKNKFTPKQQIQPTPFKEKEIVKKEKPLETQHPAAMQHKEVWNQDMIDMVHAWLKGVLKQLNKSQVAFMLQPSSYLLNVQFDSPINQNPEKDQQLMRSFALLLMQTLRHSLKRPLRGFKIMLTIKK